jgi:hypothetical protein
VNRIVDAVDEFVVGLDDEARSDTHR